MEIIGQIFGILALCASIISYQFNSQKKILIMQIIAASLFTINLALLGALSGAVLNIHGICRAAVFYQRGKYKWADSPLVVWVFAILGAVCVVLTYKSPLDILPLIGTIFTTISFFCTNPVKLRLFVLPSPPCWFTYHLMNGNIGGVINEVFVICSITVAMFRYRGKSGENTDNADKTTKKESLS